MCIQKSPKPRATQLRSANAKKRSATPHLAKSRALV
jgi:hypothetical protein